MSSTTEDPERTPGVGSGPTFDARALRDRLNQSVAHQAALGPTFWPASDAPAEIGPPVERRRAPTGGMPAARLAKSAVALVVLVAVVWGPLQAYLEVSSVEAVVNASLVTLRAPIAGIVAGGPPPAAGAIIDRGASLLVIDNPRAGTGPVDTIRDQLESTDLELTALRNKLADRQAEAANLDAQVQAFRDARLSILDIDAKILDQQLLEAGAQSQPASQIVELRLRRTRLAVERQALAAGVFAGDSYNDRPQSAQRLAEAHRSISDTEADIARETEHARFLRQTLARLSQRQDRQARAEIANPEKARVWEVLVSPGEQVNEGQELLRLVQCDSAVVTASVNESVFNRLAIGMPAEFVLSGSGDRLAGTVVNVTGMAGASSTYAIDPSALAKQPYRVTIAIVGLAGANGCQVGRTGEVYFGEQPIDAMVQRVIDGLRGTLQ